MCGCFNFVTTIMLAHGKFHIEQMGPGGLPKLGGVAYLA
jgi:hypothetical protein